MLKPLTYIICSMGRIEHINTYFFMMKCEIKIFFPGIYALIEEWSSDLPIAKIHEIKILTSWGPWDHLSPLVLWYMCIVYEKWTYCWVLNKRRQQQQQQKKIVWIEEALFWKLMIFLWFQARTQNNTLSRQNPLKIWGGFLVQGNKKN